MPSEVDVVLDADELAAVVSRLGGEIARAHPEGVLLVGVLPGCLFLVADLLRCVDVEIDVDFLAVSAFESGGGRVRILKDLDHAVTGRSVVVVEDIVDTGLTVAFLADVLSRRGAASVEVCALFDRPSHRFIPTPVRFTGVEVDGRFLVGYGLGHRGRYANLDRVVAIEEAPVDAALDRYVEALYAGRRA